MKSSEQTFLQAIQNKDPQEAYDRFNDLYNVLDRKYLVDDRSLKNYMISLNGIIFFIIKSDCNKDSCYNLRKKIADLFESCTSREDLKSCSLDMIDFYLDACNDNLLKTSNATVNSAIIFMRKNLSQPIGLKEVADSVHISRSYLSSLLSKHTNSSFPILLKQMRVEHAKTLLLDTNASIMEVAEKCGFNSQSYFCSSFKKLEGCTPSVFRDENK